MPLKEVDARSLAAALDELAREVLYLDRPVHETWEQLRREMLSQRPPRRRLANQ